MLKSKTVFVIGAGASSEVGLPIGSGLKDVISKKLNIKFDLHRQKTGDQTIGAAYGVASVHYADGLGVNTYRQAGIAIGTGLSTASSIDDYLDSHSGNLAAERCGKLAIASSILEAERASTMYPESSGQLNLSGPGLRSTWYPALSTLLMQGVHKSDAHGVLDNASFIIFNYDRCVENYLYYALQARFQINSSAAAKILSGARIFHPYGTVGKLPYLADGDGIEFGSGIDEEDLLTVSKNIRTFSERIDDDEFVDRMRQAYGDSEAIVFLGFSFAPQNMNLLAWPAKDSSGNARRVYATTFGISQSHQDLIQRDINRSLKGNDELRKFYFENAKCTDMFQKHSYGMANG